jgi:carbon monoxide dehydrogenase subunit G
VRIEGSYTFEAPQEAVWQALLDPEVLAKTMPGCEKLEKVGESEFNGVMKIRIGPMQGEFKGGVVLSELNPPDGYRMKVSGRGPSGFMDGTGAIRLEGQGGSTVMHYEGDAQVGGSIASVGNRLMDRSAKALVQQSLDQLNQQIMARQKLTESKGEGEEVTAAEVAAVVADIPAPTQTEFALGVAKNFLDDLVPAEKQPQIIRATIAGVIGLLILQVISNLFAERVARRTAAILRKERR